MSPELPPSKRSPGNYRFLRLVGELLAGLLLLGVILIAFLILLVAGALSGAPP